MITKEILKTVYQTEDGKIFDNERQALNHEKYLGVVRVVKELPQVASYQRWYFVRDNWEYEKLNLFLTHGQWIGDEPRTDLPAWIYLQTYYDEDRGWGSHDCCLDKSMLDEMMGEF